jgi:hypothetical protein
MKLTTGLVEVLVDLVEQNEKNGRQLETEKAKVASAGGSQQPVTRKNERLEFLIAKKHEVLQYNLMVEYLCF